MKKSFSFLVLLLVLVLSVSATPAPVTLGPGLSYVRLQSLAESEEALRTAVPGAGALVLDLRYTVASDESAGLLRTALAGHSAAAPLFILVSPATPAGLADIINQAPGTLITLGLAGSRPAPKLMVRTDAEADRRAYDAFTAGTPLEALISGKIEKERFDEATLVKEFKNGNPDAEPPPARDPSAPKPAGAAENPPPLVDRVLQRAVHLHQALLALRR